MAAINSNGTGGGNWNAGASWNGGAVPGAGDTATILNGDTITVTADQVVDQVTVNATGALVLNDGFDLTGMTGADMTVSGTLTMGAGCVLSFNDAAGRRILFGGTGKMYVNGTSGARSTFTNVGANYAYFHNPKVLQFRYMDCPKHGSDGVYINPGNFATIDMEDVDIIGIGSGDGFDEREANVAMRLKRVWISNLTEVFAGSGAYIAFLEDVTFGASRDGTPNANTRTFSNPNQAVIGHSVRSLDTDVFYQAQLVLIDNWGYSSNGGLPGAGYYNPGNSASSLPNIGSIERSTAAPKAGETYHARSTPLSAASTTVPLDISLYIPVITGDTVSVSGWASRSGMTSDCAKIVLDPEEAWGTSVTSAELLTNADTYYNLTADSAALAGGVGAKGKYRIVLRCDEYEASKVVDWAACTIDVTHADTTVTRYVVSMQNWESGMPTVDKPDFPTEAQVEKDVEYNDENKTGTLAAGGGAIIMAGMGQIGVGVH